MVKIYTDTNVLHYLGGAFRTETVPEKLAVRLLLAPIAILELLSQLGTKDAESAFAAVQALPRVHNPEACGVLPWSDDFFRMCLFQLPPNKDLVTQSINNAIVRVLNANNAAELKAEGEEMRELLDNAKQEALNNFASLRDNMRTEGRLDAAEDRRIFAQSIARKADINPESVDVDFIVTHLAAHYCFEQQRIDSAATNSSYNIEKRINDEYDAELLIYLADPSLNLLTCDRGFRRAKNSSQGARIHIVQPDMLQSPEGAIAILQSIARLP
ncbi:MAG: hypothetical protein HOQ35_07380 [Acidobacteriaceae bacterium]|nr:hypothetical protein [Acidobacteriaceae bacterium]